MVFKMLSEDQMIIGSRKKLYFWNVNKKKISNPLVVFEKNGNSEI